MNIENFQNVLDQIIAHPETWDQTDWHCGATHCFAGWAQLLSGRPANGETARCDARIYLDLSGKDADFLFDPSRTQEDFLLFRDGYTRDGYNRDRYDRAGYNRDGYDRDGLDGNNKPQTTQKGA